MILVYAIQENVNLNCRCNELLFLTEKGQLYTFGDGRHGKLAHGSDQFSNQFKPFHCNRFSSFNVEKVSLN